MNCVNNRQRNKCFDAGALMNELKILLLLRNKKETQEEDQVTPISLMSSFHVFVIANKLISTEQQTHIHFLLQIFSKFDGNLDGKLTSAPPAQVIFALNDF